MLKAVKNTVSVVGSAGLVLYGAYRGLTDEVRAAPEGFEKKVECVPGVGCWSRDVPKSTAPKPGK